MAGIIGSGTATAGTGCQMRKENHRFYGSFSGQIASKEVTIFMNCINWYSE
jgi:hypothetical protein